MKTCSVALTEKLHAQAVCHLIREDGQEDLCFGLWYPSAGRSRQTALVHQLILPEEGDRELHGNVSFLPAYFERAASIAAAKGAGLAFFHSHPADGWQAMSPNDINAEQRIAGAVLGATGFPLVGLTVGTDGAWSARFWERAGPRAYERRWCSSVRVAGEGLMVTFCEDLVPRPRFRKELTRTISAWGEETQAKLARLRIGVVGTGSVGSIVAEALARMGIMRVTLIDFDLVETINLDRTLHATRQDAWARRTKVSMLGKALKRSATAEGFVADSVEFSVVEEEGFRAALDCDLLFSCVDRPWARSVLNFVAYAHLIPVVDGGLSLETTRNGQLRRADWKTHIVGPHRRCLECLGQYDPGFVPVEREGLLDDLHYIEGLPREHVLRRNENVFGFSLSVASLEVLQMLMMVVAPLGISNAGAQAYHFVPGIFDDPKFEVCDEGCLYPGLAAKGDATGFSVTGRDLRAEQLRREQRHRGTRHRRSRSSG